MKLSMEEFNYEALTCRTRAGISASRGGLADRARPAGGRERADCR